MDDFDQYCKWAMKPNEFMEEYQARALGSYEILDRSDYISSENLTDNDLNIRENGSNMDLSLEKEVVLGRIRSFKRTHKGLINQGDTIKNQSLLSLNLPIRSKSFTKGEASYRFGFPDKSPISSPDEQNSINILNHTNMNDEKKETKTFEIFVVGKAGVGKTTLCEQFLTSENCGFSSNIGSSNRIIRQVTVDLDDNEWNLLLHDYDNPMTLGTAEKSPDAYIIVYSIEDKDSFDWCTQTLQTLLESFSTSAIFIVANKSDLERLRQVACEKGKRLAGIYDAEFFEVSTILNPMVDNLLVQIIMKIRRHKKKLRKAKDSNNKYSMKHKRSTPGNLFMDFFRRLSRAF